MTTEDKVKEDEFLKKVLTSFGTRNPMYWCKHCGGYVTNGHEKDCLIILGAIHRLGKSWVDSNMIIKD